MKALYQARATAVGGREGHARTDDGKLEVSLALPRELGGNGNGTNPEQLFAAGYAACFENAVRHVARLQKKTITASSVTATVGIGPNESGGFGLEVALDVRLEGIERSDAEMLVKIAHEQVCPYSNATRGNIPVTVTLA
ncbi:organic hydroperoxide resistance protein [Chitinivorax sp. PXF-14]|uniref:organic hydroperoxide resistance protein n=1 Tax=Chitinivorax sp. PXF-14 TaxID=3230488 RepID=UPI00346611A0